MAGNLAIAIFIYGQDFVDRSLFHVAIKVSTPSDRHYLYHAKEDVYVQLYFEMKEPTFDPNVTKQHCFVPLSTNLPENYFDLVSSILSTIPVPGPRQRGETANHNAMENMERHKYLGPGPAAYYRGQMMNLIDR